MQINNKGMETGGGQKAIEDRPARFRGFQILQPFLAAGLAGREPLQGVSNTPDSEIAKAACRDESQFSRLACLEAQLHIASAMTMLAASTNGSPDLRASFFAFATHAHHAVATMVAQKYVTTAEAAALEGPLQRLQHALASVKTAAEQPSGPGDKRSRGCRDTLTDRERQVLRLIAEGYSTKEIAGQLSVSFKTAACHRYHIMEKLGLHDTVRLVRYAIRSGMVEP